jgi:hypothetical protein
MYAVIADWATGGEDTRNYDEISRRMGFDDDPPAGLVAHAAGATPEGGFRILGLWETREAFEEFRSERLEPTAHAVISALPPERQAASGPPELTIYPVHHALVASESSTRLPSGSRT